MQSTESAVAKSSLWTEHLILGRVLASLAPSHKITAGINTHLAWRVPTSWFATELTLDRLAFGGRCFRMGFSLLATHNRAVD